MNIAIFFKRTEGGEVISVCARIVFPRPPIGQPPERFELKDIKSELEKDGWVFDHVIQLCDEGYFDNRVDARFVEAMENVATRIASGMYFKGSAHGHNEAVMEH